MAEDDRKVSRPEVLSASSSARINWKTPHTYTTSFNLPNQAFQASSTSEKLRTSGRTQTCEKFSKLPDEKKRPNRLSQANGQKKVRGVKQRQYCGDTAADSPTASEGEKLNLIIPSMRQSLFDSSLQDIAVDAVEVSIDNVIADETLQAIPIVRTFLGVGKTVQNIRDRYLISKTVKFLLALRDEDIPEEQRRAHQEKLDADPDFAKETLTRVLAILDSMTDEEKAKVLAKLYRGYVERAITWQQFCELTEMTQRVFLDDIPLLKDIRSGRISDTAQCPDDYRAVRLEALGFIAMTTKSIVVPSSSKTARSENLIRVTAFGELFCDLIG